MLVPNVILFFLFSSYILQLSSSLDKSLVPSDIFLDIDGISIAPSIIHICALISHEDFEAGKLKCWGFGDPQKIQRYQSNVRFKK